MGEDGRFWCEDCRFWGENGRFWGEDCGSGVIAAEVQILRRGLRIRGEVCGYGVKVSDSVVKIADSVVSTVLPC